MVTSLCQNWIVVQLSTNLLIHPFEGLKIKIKFKLKTLAFYQKHPQKTCLLPIYWRSTSSSYQLVSLPFLPLATLFTTACLYQFVSLPLRLLTTLTVYHFVFLPLWQFTISSPYRFVSLPFCHYTILSVYNFVIFLPLCQFTTSSCDHFDILLLSAYHCQLTTVNHALVPFASLPTYHLLSPLEQPFSMMEQVRI